MTDDELARVRSDPALATRGYVAAYIEGLSKALAPHLKDVMARARALETRTASTDALIEDLEARIAALERQGDDGSR